MPYFNRIQDRHSILDPSAIPYQSFYIADPPAVPESLFYQLNRAGSLQRFSSQFLIRRDREYPFAVLLRVTEGKGRLTLEDRRYDFEAGQVVVLPPYTQYELCSDSQDPFSIVWAEFCGGDSRRLIHYIMTHNGPLFEGEVYSAAEGITMSLLHPPRTDRRAWISRRLYETMLLFCEACSQKEPEQQEDIYQILDYIDQHLGESLTLKTMSEAFGYSASYFSRFFLQRTGVHFSQYLLRQRVERARQLLLSTDLSVEQIAHQLGFCDASHFVRKFRETVGEAPACYRRKHLI